MEMEPFAVEAEPGSRAAMAVQASPARKNEFTCLHCGYGWNGKKRGQRPAACPACKRKDFDVPPPPPEPPPPPPEPDKCEFRDEEDNVCGRPVGPRPDAVEYNFCDVHYLRVYPD